MSVEPSAHSQEVLCRHALTAFYSEATQRRGPSGQELPGRATCRRGGGWAELEAASQEEGWGWLRQAGESGVLSSGDQVWDSEAEVPTRQPHLP